jgi:hypothetical protein
MSALFAPRRRNLMTRTTSSRPLTELQHAELEALAALADEAIDTSDIPEITDDRWALARKGAYHRSVQQSAATKPK